jgi:hypothetical protein
MSCNGSESLETNPLCIFAKSTKTFIISLLFKKLFGLRRRRYYMIGRAIVLVVFFGGIGSVAVYVVSQIGSQNRQHRRQVRSYDSSRVVLHDAVQYHAPENSRMLDEGMGLLDRLLAVDGVVACLPASERKRARDLRADFRRSQEKRRGLPLDVAVQKHAVRDYLRLEGAMDFWEDLLRADENSGLSYVPDPELRTEAKELTVRFRRSQRELGEG